MKSKPTLPLLPPSGLGLPKALQPTTAPPAHHVHKLPKKKKLVQRSSLEPTICTQIKTRGARGSSTGTTAGKKRSKKPPAPEHPLSIDFSESVTATSTILENTLPLTLADALASATASIEAHASTSSSYLSAAAAQRERFGSVTLLDPEFIQRMEEGRCFLQEKQALLDTLWARWRESVDAILLLEKEADQLEKNHKAGDFGKDGDGGGEKDGEEEEGRECEAWCEEIRAVGRKWVQRMEESEKKFSEEAKKKRELAMAAML